MRQVELEYRADVPQVKRETNNLKYWMQARISDTGTWGMHGKPVGIGFHWYTRTGVTNERLFTIVKRVKRALRSSGMIGTDCDLYNLEQRIEYIRDGDGHAVITLREG